MECVCVKTAPAGVETAAACLGQLWIFNDLAPEEREFMAGEARRRQFAVGETVFARGEPADDLFLLKCGRVKLSRVLEDGRELTLDIRQAGDFIGETMLAAAGIYPVDAVCLEPVMTCGFTRRQLEDIVLAHPNIALQLIRNLSARLAIMTEKVGNMAGGTIGRRLHRLLAAMAAEHGRSRPDGRRLLPFVLTHEELGFLAGAHRVSITRALGELKEAGLVVPEGRYLLVAPTED